MTDANQGDNEIASLMETSAPHATAIPELTSGFTTTTPPPPPVSALETEMSKLKQTNQFAEAVSSILAIVDQYLASKMKEAVHVDSTIKKIIKDQVKEQVSKMVPKIEKYVTETLGAEVLVRTTNQPQTAYAVAASLSKFKLKKILINKMEANKSINRTDAQKKLYNALDEMIKTRMKTPLLDQTEGRKEGNQSLGMSVYAEEPSYTVEEPGMQQDQEFVMRDNNEQNVDKELTNLTIDERYDLNMALRMFTRRIVIQKRLEDLQLGVKRSLTSPNPIDTDQISRTKPHTSCSNPHGIIYMDPFKRKRLMHTDELHKFSDGTLNDVRTELHDIATRIRMDYLPMRKCGNLVKKQVQVML
nr:hypothetical protein [Tanacetum cinerariifolium]